MGFPLTKATKKYQQRQVLSCVEINSLGLLEKKNYSYSFYFPYPFGSPRLHVYCQCLVLNLKQVCLKIPFVFGAEKWLEYYLFLFCVCVDFFFFIRMKIEKYSKCSIRKSSFRYAELQCAEL